MTEFKQGLYWVGTVLIVALALYYIFAGIDIIPEGPLRGIGPAALVAYLDDAIIVLGMIFALRKWNEIVFKKKSAGKFHVAGYIVYGLIIIVCLWYIFLGVDLIPDSSPYVGLLDDAGVVIAGVLVAARLRKIWLPRGASN